MISDEHRGALPRAVQLFGEADVSESPLRRLQVGEGLHGVPQTNGALLFCAPKMSRTYYTYRALIKNPPTVAQKFFLILIRGKMSDPNAVISLSFCIT